MRRGRAAKVHLLLSWMLSCGGCPSGPPDDTPEEPCDATPWYPDRDGDGFGDEYHPLFACVTPDDFTDQPGDCDDTTAAVHPAATEECDGLDNDCDGEVDESTTPGTAHLDADGDGHGDPGVTSPYHCVLPDGYVEDGDDCDDADPAVHPGAIDALCDGVDSDCDGTGSDVAAVIEDAEYGTIQDAIDAATTGDVVRICPGTHIEILGIPDVSEVSVEAFSGSPDDTVLDGQLLDSILVIGSGAAVTLSHLTFRNGAAIYPDANFIYSQGGAVHSCGDSLVIEDCRFENNSASWRGGAVEVRNLPSYGCGYDNAELVSLSVSDSVFEDNFTNTEGGAIGIDLACPGEVTIAGTEIRGSWAHYQGGGIYAVTEGDLEILIRDSFFEGNEAMYIGGGINARVEGDVSLQVTDTSFVGNVSGYAGGAVHLEPDLDAEISIAGSTFEGNVAGYDGGGLSVDGDGDATVEIAGCSWTDQVSGNSGGAAMFDLDGHVEMWISDSAFLRNLAAYCGGGLFLESSSASIGMQGCVLAENTSDHSGAGLALEATLGDLNGDLNLSDCSLTDNVSGYTGGAIYSEMTLLDLSGVHLSGNSALVGGGAIFHGSTYLLAEIFLSDSWVTGNSGGGVYLSDLSVLHSETTDWGSDGTDNGPYDVDTNEIEYTWFTTGESFTCVSRSTCY